MRRRKAAAAAIFIKNKLRGRVDCWCQTSSEGTKSRKALLLGPKVIAPRV